jgi:heat shock protein HslJ
VTSEGCVDEEAKSCLADFIKAGLFLSNADKTNCMCHFQKSNLSLLCAVVLMFFIGNACNSVKTSNPGNSLSGKSFTLESKNGIAASVDSFPKGLPTLVLKTEGSLGGNTGCNEFFGTYSQSQNTIKLEVTGMTKMFCLGVDETGFIQLLHDTDSFQWKKNKLQLLKAGKVLMVFNEKVTRL